MGGWVNGRTDGWWVGEEVGGRLMVVESAPRSSLVSLLTLENCCFACDLFRLWSARHC